MKKKAAVQNFKIRLTEFYTFMMTILSFMKRDKDEFVKHGVTDEKIVEMEEMLEDYSNFPTDDELVGVQRDATEKKEHARQALQSAISEVINRAANKYGTDTGYYRQFGIKSLSDLDGGELSTGGRRVHRVGTVKLGELSSEGLTQEILDTLKTSNKEFDKALATQEDAISNREIVTEDRIEKANAIYAIMSKYCVKGKNIWVSKNQAKYNDYVIYDTPTGKPEEEKEA